MYNYFYRLQAAAIIIVCALMCGKYAQTVNDQVNVTENPTSLRASMKTDLPSSSTTVKPPENISCEVYNNDCKACVAQSQCYYCDENDKCNYHVQSLIADGECNIKNVHYLTCRMNFKVMMIMVSVMIGIALLIITCVCCYCCCKKRGVKLSKDDLKWARQREERKQIADDKRKERAERTEEIRKKYGLVKDSNPYQRFDA